MMSNIVWPWLSLVYIYLKPFSTIFILMAAHTLIDFVCCVNSPCCCHDWIVKEEHGNFSILKTSKMNINNTYFICSRPSTTKTANRTVYVSGLLIIYKLVGTNLRKLLLHSNPFKASLFKPCLKLPFPLNLSLSHTPTPFRDELLFVWP